MGHLTGAPMFNVQENLLLRVLLNGENTVPNLAPPHARKSVVLYLPLNGQNLFGLEFNINASPFSVHWCFTECSLSWPLGPFVEIANGQTVSASGPVTSALSDLNHKD